MMERFEIRRYDLFEIEHEARRLRAEATANWVRSFAAWLRKPRALAAKDAGQIA